MYGGESEHKNNDHIMKELSNRHINLGAVVQSFQPADTGSMVNCMWCN